MTNVLSLTGYFVKKIPVFDGVLLVPCSDGSLFGVLGQPRGSTYIHKTIHVELSTDLQCT